MMRSVAWVVLLGCACALSACGSSKDDGAAASGAKKSAASKAPTKDVSPGDLRSLIIGGGDAPESTEVSIEQNVALAAKTLPEPVTVLFAGGADALSVRVEEPIAPTPTVLTELGDLFAPRAGRRSHYRASTLPAVHPADVASLESRLTAALGAGTAPLFVYVAAHGGQGETAKGNTIATWGGDGLTVGRMAELSDGAKRPLRMVVTTCFSGGFADLAFEGADETKGAAKADRCGLLSGTWDRETSGCDPNPDRDAQESYSLYMLQALGGHDRKGKALALASVDFDGDGRIGLLDAHTYARIHARSIDVPTSTSERYLRSVSTERATPDLAVVPEEAATIRELGKALGIYGEISLNETWTKTQATMTALDEDLTTANEAVDDTSAALITAVLGRWPVLDDPYHPDFPDMFRTQSDQIGNVLHDSALGKAFKTAQSTANAKEYDYADGLVREAQLLRLMRAYETLALATSLKAHGGEAWDHYQALLACERTIPER